MQTEQTGSLFPAKVNFEDILRSAPCFLSVQDRDLRIVATLISGPTPTDIWQYDVEMDDDDFSLAGFQKFCK